MSKLNPNAGAWTPSFTSAVTTSAVTPVVAPSPVTAPTLAVVASKPATIVTSIDSVPTANNSAAGQNDATDVDMATTDSSRITYSIDYLLQFQPICDAVPCYFPDVVRAPPPQKLGHVVNDRLVYTVAELLQFEPLYRMPPSDFTWTETLVNDPTADKKAKTPVKSKKEKAKQRALDAQQLQYDPTLMCYFNPTEYAAALNMAMYSAASGESTRGPSAAGSGVEYISTSVNGSDVAVNAIEESIVAKRRLAALLDEVAPETVTTLLKSFDDITVSCTHTLQEVIGLLFDRAIAKPELSDAFALLCSGIAERTPEFKEGAKTINFRRILLTKCYEALVEEPETPSGEVNGLNANAALAQHSWRRQCMLQNVGFIGELFRRQLLTENIMHVCVAMMLEDEVNPQMDVIEAACRLVSLVGDLLDGSSPASRRTMDEYFEVLIRLSDHAQAPQHLKDLITEMCSLRASGWIRKRLEVVASASSPLKAVSAIATPKAMARVTIVANAQQPSKAAHDEEMEGSS